MKKLLTTFSFLSASALAACQPVPETAVDLKIRGTTERFKYQTGDLVKLLGNNSVPDQPEKVKTTDRINKAYRIITASRQFTPEGTIDRSFLDQIKLMKKDKHVILQYQQNLTEIERKNLEKEGVKITAPLSSKTYLASVPGTSNLESILDAEENKLRYIGEFKPADKLGRIWDKNAAGQIKGLQVIFHKDVDYQKAKTLLEQSGAIIKNSYQKANSFGVTAAKSGKDANLGLAKELSKLDEVYLVGQPMPLLSQSFNARKFSRSDMLEEEIPGLDGLGVKIMVYDAGYVDNEHPDLKKRSILPDDFQEYGTSFHATHVACIAAGDGSASTFYIRQVCEDLWMFNVEETAQYKEICKQYFEDKSSLAYFFKGMAPKATVITEDHGPCGIYCMVENPNQILKKINWAVELGAVAAGASLGPNVRRNGFPCHLLGYYDSVATTLDLLVRGDLGDKPIAISFSAGNERRLSEEDSRCFQEGERFGFYSIGGGPATGKNILTISAVTLDGKGNLGDTNYASRGPLAEDNARVKPTLVAYGGSKEEGVISCSFSGNYIPLAGTSMAQPVVLGNIAKLTQAYKNKFRTDKHPSPQLLYSILVNSAEDRAVGDNRYVDWKTGFGLVNVYEAHKNISEKKFVEKTVKETGERHTYFFKTDGVDNLEVTLAYLDYAGSFLVNDLDVELVSPSGRVYFPHVLDPARPNDEAQRHRDSFNNIEKITLDLEAEKEVGLWEVRVTASDLVVGPQDYAIAFSHPPLESEKAEVVRYDGKGNTIVGQIQTTLYWRECPECDLKKELGPFRGPTVELGPGGIMPFDSVLPGFRPDKEGIYLVKAEFMNGDKPYADKEGNPLKKIMYFMVKDKK